MSDPARLGIADLQIHTSRSDGMASPEQVVRWAAQAGLDLIAVTDHDDLRGAREAQEAAARMQTPLGVIAGVEVTTRAGHLLALFVTSAPAPFRSLAFTVDAVHAQGGVCVIPHPLSPLTASVGRRSLDRLLADGVVVPDAIELAGATPAARWGARRARRFNRERWQLAETGGSDAHFPEYIGAAVTRFPGRSGEDLRRALAARLTIAEQRPAPSLRQVGPRRLLQQQGRGLLATPRATLWRPLRRRIAHRRGGAA